MGPDWFRVFFRMTLSEAINYAKERGKPLCCIVRFSQTREDPHCFYQAVVDPNKVTRSGKFIRFESPGTEVFGFKPVDSLQVYEILGEVQEDGITVRPIEEEPRALHASGTPPL